MALIKLICYTILYPIIITRMSESVIASFYLSPSVDLKEEFKDRFFKDGKVLWSKALCRNPTAFPFLKKYMKKWLPFHFKRLSRHCSDLDFLQKYEDKLDYSELSANPHALPILKKHIDRVDWEELSANPNAVWLLKQYPEKVDWSVASSNTSPDMIEWLEKEHSRIDWFELSFNPSAVPLLRKYPNKVDLFAINLNSQAAPLLKEHPEWIDYKLLSSNPSKEAMELVKQNLSKASFENLSSNEYAIDILLANPDKIDWEFTKENPKVGVLYSKFPQELDLSNTGMFESMLPFLSDSNSSSVVLALNPGIFYVDKAADKQQNKILQSIISKFKKTSS